MASVLVGDFEFHPIARIFGPSSSNKATFAKRLVISLRARGCRSLIIKMDDCFIDREGTRFGPDGLPN
jgi:molybdopterin-guanine dinucleotide biosynthesis protein